MKMIFALGAAGLLATAAHAAAPPARSRGTLVAATATSLTLRTPAGATESFMLTPKTRYAAVSQGSLADVQAGRFIGTATKDQNGQEIALEIAVFPNAMRGTGEGHYAWDEITDTTATMPAKTASSMTNGNVSAAMPTRMTASSMTNGNISAASTAGAGKTLTIIYAGGSRTVLVPVATPVVTMAPAGPTLPRPGESVLVFSRQVAGHAVALSVSAGINGTKLPM